VQRRLAQLLLGPETLDPNGRLMAENNMACKTASQETLT